MHVRNKGHNAEREFVKILEESLGVEASRNVDQVREGGADIVTVRPFAIEVKRQQQLNIKSWQKQALSQCTKKNPIPVLAFRQNRQKWRIMMLTRDLFKKKYIIDDEWCEITLVGFISVAKEMLGK